MTGSERVGAPSTTREIGSVRTATDYAEPWEYGERLRSVGEIVWDEESDAWLVSSYELIRQVALGDCVSWSRLESYLVNKDDSLPEPRYLGLTREDAVKVGGISRWSPELLAGDDHARVHRWWVRAFSPRTLDAWKQTKIRSIVDARVARLAAAGGAELAAEFAEVVAPQTMFAYLDLPWDEAMVERTHEFHREIQAVMDAEPRGADEKAALVDRQAATTEEFYGLFEPYVMARRNGDGDDFISRVWREVPPLWGGDYTDFDIVAVCGQAFLAGAGVTSAAISNGIHLLLERPELQEKLRDGGENAVAGFAEEALRLYPIVPFLPRVALRDLELGGVTIRAGDTVILALGAGNRDPLHYPLAPELDVGRRAARDHYSFFVGARYCPGHGLARAQLQAAFSALVERARLRRDPDRDAPRWRGTFLQSWAPLHAIVTPKGPRPQDAAIAKSAGGDPQRG
jgi:cytochrome P450